MAFYLSTPNKKPTPCRKDSFESDLAYLEQQIIMRDQAIKKAECLISLYCKENAEIKEQNRQLKNVICQYDIKKVQEQAQLMHYQCKRQIKALLQEKVELLYVIKLHQSQIRYLTKSRKDKEQRDQRPKTNKHHLKTSYTYGTIADQPQSSLKQYQNEQASKNKMKKMMEQKLQMRSKEVIKLLQKVHDLQHQCGLVQSCRDQSLNPQFSTKTPKKLIVSTIRKQSNSLYSQNF